MEMKQNQMLSIQNLLVQHLGLLELLQYQLLWKMQRRVQPHTPSTEPEAPYRARPILEMLLKAVLDGGPDTTMHQTAENPDRRRAILPPVLAEQQQPRRGDRSPIRR